MSARATATATEEKGFVTAKPIAEYYSVKEATIYRWADEKKIPCMRFEGTVRFKLEDVRLAMEGESMMRCDRTQANAIPLELTNLEVPRSADDASSQRLAVNRILMEFFQRIEPNIDGLISELREAAFDRQN